MSWQENVRVRQFLGEGSRQNHPHSKSKLTKIIGVSKSDNETILDDRP